LTQWTVTTAVAGGEARHHERSLLTPLESKWHSKLAGARVAVDLRTRPGFELSLQGLGYWTETNDEHVQVSPSIPFSSNELNMQAYEAQALFGWGFTAEGVGRFSVLGGLLAREATLERKFGPGLTDKLDTQLALPTAELRAWLPIPLEDWERPLAFYATGAFGLLINPSADVKGYGSIKGDGGWMLRTRAGFNYQFSDHVGFFVGGFFEKLEIEGGSKDGGEWPDSMTTAYGGEAGLTFKF
jgi:hypothetical protein